jgi:proteasome lid subunit RPN8/RPN11
MTSDVYDHAFSTTEHEVGGVFVGRQNAAGPPVIHASIRAARAEAQASELTFTHDSWEHIHSVIDRRYPTEQIVGWYHTHPGYGLFLSAQDRFIHGNFFQGAGQIAVVLDPIAGEEAVFRWAGTDLVEHYRRPCAWSEPAPRNSAPQSPAADRLVSPPPATAHITGELPVPVDRRRSPTATTVIYLLAITVSLGTVVWELLLK